MRNLKFDETSKDLDIKEFTTAKMTTVKAIPNATIKATAPTMVKAIPNATIKATGPTMVKAIRNPTVIEVLAETPKNTTSIVSKLPSNVALHDNGTSIELANKIIDAASMASLNAHGSLADRG